MPIGDPPTKPADDASDADFEKYRHDFDVYVAEKLAQFAETELNLRADQKTVDERLRDLDGRERGIVDQEKALATERDKMDAREIMVSSGEDALRKEEKNYTEKMNILKRQQAEAQVEEKRLKTLKKDLEERRSWSRHRSTTSLDRYPPSTENSSGETSKTRTRERRQRATGSKEESKKSACRKGNQTTHFQRR